jgi:hypothetical protein
MYSLSAFTLWNPTSLQCLLQYEIVKSDPVVADGCKIAVRLVTMYNRKFKILNYKIKLLKNICLFCLPVFLALQPIVVVFSTGR